MALGTRSSRQSTRPPNVSWAGKDDRAIGVAKSVVENASIEVMSSDSTLTMTKARALGRAVPISDREPAPKHGIDRCLIPPPTPG
jgi:hypothetical protein